MKTRLPKGLLALVAAVATSTAYAGYYTPTTITTEGEMQLGAKATEVGGYTIDAKDGAGTATVTGDVTSGSAIYVREGKLIIGGTDSHNTVTVNTTGGGQHRQGDSPNMLSVAGKNSTLVVDNATLTTDKKVTTAIGGADGNGTLIIQNGGKYIGSNQDYFVIGYQSYRLGTSTPLSPHVQLVHATTQGALGAENSDNSDLANRYQGEYSSGANGTQFGRGVVTVTGNSELITSGVYEFTMGHGELNVLDNSTFTTSAKPVLLGYSVGCTSLVNVESGSVMNLNGQLQTGTYQDAEVVINVTDATVNLNNYKGSFLGLGSWSDDAGDYVNNGSTTEVNLNDGAVMNVTEEMYVGYSSDASVNVAASAAIQDSGDARDRMFICGAGTVENAGTINLNIDITGGQLTAHDGAAFAGITNGESSSMTVDGSITLSGALSMQGGTLTLAISSANLQQASITAASYDAQSGNVVLRATENLKAGTYHIINVTESEDSGEEPGEESGDAPSQISATQSGVQYTLIGVDGLETTWEGGDLFLTLDEQLIVARDPFSDAMMAANWGVFHSSQAFTGTLWAPRTAASCTEVEGKHTVWATAYSSFISQNGTGNFQGADYSIYGASMGVETPLGKNRIIGAAFGYDIGKASMSNTSDVDQTSCHIAAYGRAAVWCYGEQGNLAIDWSAAYGRTTSEHTAVAGDWTQDSFQLDARATYSRNLTARTAVSAFFGAQYYAQDDASTARSQADAIKNFRLMLGTGIQQAVTERTTVFGEAMLRQDVMRDNPNVMVDGFRYGSGANPGRFGGSISAGVEHQINDDWKVRANYSFEVSDEQNEHSFGAGASYSF